ncbi:MAG: tRNA guanosine(34) transglycosylase Tgt, partial [Patescibacteria group bacterium]
WKGPTMTDSGGFQAFSLGVAYGGKLSKFIAADAPELEEIKMAYDPPSQSFSEAKERKAKITEGGVEFRSVIDGSTHFFTPEKSIQIQHNLGADMIFALDECTSPHAGEEYLRTAMERTHRWAERCLIENNKTPRSPGEVSLFGIVQGGRSETLRKESAKFLSRICPSAGGFDGFGIGGSFVKEDMATAVRWVNEILPKEKPRHLLGVGEPVDLILAVENGCDTFDCVAPTRIARNGELYTKNGKINITNSKYKNLFSKLDSECECYTCKNFTAAYLHHLFHAKEMLAATLATIHNLYFINTLVSNIRKSIIEERFGEFKKNFLSMYNA